MENTVSTIEQAPQIPEEGFIPVVSEVQSAETLDTPETIVQTEPPTPVSTDKSALMQVEGVKENDVASPQELSPQYGFPYTTGSRSGMAEMVHDKQAGVRPV